MTNVETMSDWDDENEPHDGPDDDDGASPDDDLIDNDDDDRTIPCPACGAGIYEDADQCPRCGEWIAPGAAVSRRRGWATAVVLLMVILMLALALC